MYIKGFGTFRVLTRQGFKQALQIKALPLNALTHWHCSALGILSESWRGEYKPVYLDFVVLKGKVLFTALYISGNQDIQHLQ